jgi:hypothetical protein
MAVISLSCCACQLDHRTSGYYVTHLGQSLNKAPSVIRLAKNLSFIVVWRNSDLYMGLAW